MAVEKGQQGKGLGKIVMRYLEEKSIARGDLGMILHAREKSIGFYENLGYTTIEQSYLLFGEIQHYLMQKEYAGAK
jgi:GNAT superfamily N-acetyltransferase